MDDLRIPTGFFFSLLGVVLLIYAAINPHATAPMSAGIPVNLWTGLTLLVFGGLLLWLSRRTKS